MRRRSQARRSATNLYRFTCVCEFWISLNKHVCTVHYFQPIFYEKRRVELMWAKHNRTYTHTHTRTTAHRAVHISDENRFNIHRSYDEMMKYAIRTSEQRNSHEMKKGTGSPWLIISNVRAKDGRHRLAPIHSPLPCTDAAPVCISSTHSMFSVHYSLLFCLFHLFVFISFLFCIGSHCRMDMNPRLKTKWINLLFLDSVAENCMVILGNSDSWILPNVECLHWSWKCTARLHLLLAA